MCEDPERLLFVQVLQQEPNYEIHSLTVSDGRVALDESVEYIAQRSDVLVNLLGCRLGVSASQVELNLAETRIRVL